MGGFMQELSLMVIDEGQQYGTDREIAVISLLQQQPLIIWTGDAEQTPGWIARTAPNAKRSRQLLLAKKHGLRSARKYCTPATLANAMTAIFSSSPNDQLAALANTLTTGSTRLDRCEQTTCQQNINKISRIANNSFQEQPVSSEKPRPKRVARGLCQETPRNPAEYRRGLYPHAAYNTTGGTHQRTRQ